MSLLRYYVVSGRVAIQGQIQYRAATYFYLVGFLIEPVVYLVVWRSVAESQGGSVAGFTVDTLTAYYIVWTLVRAMNTGFTPYAWEWRIRGGRLNEFLSKPVHPFHRDLSWFGGGKFVWIALWIPIAVVLWIAFRPSVSPTWEQAGAFFIAIWLAFLVRFSLLWLLGMVTFWTTRGSALFEIFIAGELLLSGRLVPIEFLPDWAIQAANVLPFKWTFQFPIDAVIGRLDSAAMWTGVLAQAAWSAGLITAIALVWRAATKRYTAVGG